MSASLLSLLVIPVAAAAVTFPIDESDSYVIDDAGLLTSAEEAELYAICEDLDVEHGTLMVILVISGLEDYDGVASSNATTTDLTMAIYTRMLYDRFVEPFEDPTHRDGILLVLSVATADGDDGNATNGSAGAGNATEVPEWQYGFEFGVGWTDTGAFDRAGAVASNSIEPKLAEGEWHVALKAFASHLSKSADQHISGDGAGIDSDASFADLVLTGVFCTVVIVVVVVMVLRGATGRSRSTGTAHLVHARSGIGYFRDPHEEIHIHHHHGMDHNHHGSRHGRSDHHSSRSTPSRRVGGGGRSGGGRRTGGGGRSRGGGRGGGGRSRGR